MKYSPYIMTQDGIQEHNATVFEKENDSVCSVYFEGISMGKLDSEFGAGIDITVQDMESFMADYRYSAFWCAPKFGKNPSEIPDETQGLIYKTTDEQFRVVLPVVDKQYKCVLKGKDKNTFTARIFSLYEGMNDCKTLAFVTAKGENVFELLEKCVKEALRLLNTGVRTRSERRYPEMFDYLGWCSWDAMEIRVNEADLLKKCDEFIDKKIPVKWAILDDMWAHVSDFYRMNYKTRGEMFGVMHASKLTSFEADPIRFPNGLKECIRKINDKGFLVGVWYPTTGYWMGLDPSGDAYEQTKDCLIRSESGRYIHSYEPQKAFQFYSAFNSFLRKCGASFVKIDNQSVSKMYYKNLAPIGVTARGLHDGMEASVGQHFDNTMINCMGMSSEDMWNRTVSAISRCSNDFLPEDSEWFTSHVLQCAYNDLIQGQFYWCDWDMWWTDDGQAVKNSVMRAISGGPIYVSDKIDRSNAEILKPLAFDDGKILRCDRPAFPAADCITEDPTTSGKILKLQNVAGKSGIMAVFNINSGNKSVTGTISPADVYGLSGETFAVYEHFSKTCTVLNLDEKMEVTLNSIQDFKLYCIVPIENGFAPIGRVDKFISPASIKYVHGEDIELYEKGPYAYFKDGKLVMVD